MPSSQSALSGWQTSLGSTPSPTPSPCTPSTFDSFPETLEPTNVLIELKWVLTGLDSPPGGILPCDLFPTFTLLADGGAYYIDYIDGDWRQSQTMVVHLTPDLGCPLLRPLLLSDAIPWPDGRTHIPGPPIGEAGLFPNQLTIARLAMQLPEPLLHRVQILRRVVRPFAPRPTFALLQAAGL